jgi:chromosomal replication initiator protein
VELRALEGSTLILAAPDNVRAWVQGRFAPLLQACAETVLGPGAHVEIESPHEQRSAVAASAPAVGRQELDPRMTFEQFVIGDSNRMAHAAALAVAEMPSLAYNPLFICGPPGLGKTHLLHSIANYVTEHGDGLTVRYTTGEAFTDRFVGALHTGGLEAFKAAYRGAGVLLVDDVQFLQRKARTEEEFFHTFNELKLAGAQIVLTSDRPPRDLDALEDRLRERFEAGLVCDVKPADRTTRLTILRKRVFQDEIRGVEPEALELIADRVVTNIRVLEGALIRVVAFASLTGRAVTATLAAEVLAGLYPELTPRRRTIEDIQRKTCEAFDVTLDELLSPSKAQRIALARQCAMYLSRELTDETLPSIGRAFGNRNHTTVLHACRRTAERIASDPEAYDAVRRLTEALGER